MIFHWFFREIKIVEKSVQNQNKTLQVLCSHSGLLPFQFYFSFLNDTHFITNPIISVIKAHTFTIETLNYKQNIPDTKSKGLDVRNISLPYTMPTNKTSANYMTGWAQLSSITNFLDSTLKGKINIFGCLEHSTISVVQNVELL